MNSQIGTLEIQNHLRYSRVASFVTYEGIVKSIIPYASKGKREINSFLLNLFVLQLIFLNIKIKI